MASEHIVADLIDELSDMEDDVREAARKELVTIGEPAIPQLIEALGVHSCGHLWQPSCRQ